MDGCQAASRSRVANTMLPRETLVASNVVQIHFISQIQTTFLVILQWEEITTLSGATVLTEWASMHVTNP